MTIQKEYIKLEEIIPSPYNPRIMTESQTQKLTKNLETFGLVDPIIINTKNNHIIGGHQRYRVLQEKYQDTGIELYLIRLGDIGWVFTDTQLTVKDDNHEKSLNLALNRIDGKFDEDKTRQVLDELIESQLDMDLTGFEDYELEEYTLNDIDELEDLLPDGTGFPTDEEVIQDNENDEDDAPSETPYTPLKEVEVIVKEGDKYQLGNHVLLCADSSDRDNIEKLLSGEKVDLLLTDPPYGINVVNTSSTNEREREHVIPKKTGTVGVRGPVGFVPRDETGTVEVPGVVKPREYKPVIGDDQPYDPRILLELDCPSIIWGANNFSSKLPDKNQWIVWYKKPKENEYNTFSDCELAWTNLPKKSIRMYKYLWSGLLREGPRDEELQERIHPTQKPVGLLKNIIKDTLKNDNQNILDLYGGSGSTLIACEKLGHHCYMIEIDPYYCQLIINRWEEYTGQKANKIN